MSYLYGFSVLILILKVCTGNLIVCLQTSVDVNSQIISDGCNSPETALLQDERTHRYHMIAKRDLTLPNVTTTYRNSTNIPTKETVTQLNTHVGKENISLTTPLPSYSTTNDANDEYDSDSGDDVIDVDGLNSTLATVDHHRYYKSILKHGHEETKQYWVDFKALGKEAIIINEMLSSSYRRALNVQLTFSFPFYGYILDNVTIATGGFLFTGDFVHKWLAATQYIAPLMANFDTSSSDNSMVKYIDNGTALTVQWENVLLQDNKNAGPFTFQVTISRTGHIVFVYKDIPITVSLIEDSKHPVKVGLSDAYIMEKTIFYLRKKTIYEYHKINMKEGFYVSSQTAIVFEPLPNCVQFQSCEACLKVVTSFKCEWCQQVGRCSDGLDRHRQDWIEGACLERSVTNVAGCTNLPPFIRQPKPRVISKSARILPVIAEQNSQSHVGGLGIILLILLLVAGLMSWVSYAYYNPQTTSGQMLIKYRPTTWSCRGSGAKYTAATMHSIHM